MRIKYVIHRGKKPFAKEKELFRKIIAFYGEQYPGLRFVDRGLRFSAEYDDIDIDFDFGYQNMRYRDFSGYHHVISQSCFSALGPDMNPGDIAFPSKADMMRINNASTKVRVYARTAAYNNPMGAIFDHMKEFEARDESSRVLDFVNNEFGAGKKDSFKGLQDLKVKKDAAFVESNCFFQPSKFKDVDSVLKVGEERLQIKDIQSHLEGRFDGVNCEAKQMIDNCASRLYMFGIAMDKPYAGIEPGVTEDRFGPALETAVKGYDHRKVAYFLTQFFGYCLSKGFRLQEPVVAESEQTAGV